MAEVHIAEMRKQKDTRKDIPKSKLINSKDEGRKYAAADD